MIQQLGKMNDTEKKGDNQVKKKNEVFENWGKGTGFRVQVKGLPFVVTERKKEKIVNRIM